LNAIALHRAGHWCHTHHLRLGAELVRRAIFLVYNSAIPPEVEIGPGTIFAYGGMGVVLHPRCRIGADVKIAQQVTIGGRSRLVGVPVIGDRCFLGPGAKILGPITVGEDSVVGANAVVIHDVPPRSVVAGVPARVVRANIRPEDYFDDDVHLAAAVAAAGPATDQSEPSSRIRSLS
jgi:serine O-acetyltransferase